MIESIQKLFLRDLDRLITEIEMYPNNDSLWLKPEGINNSSGTLALHLAGNLNHFIGAVIGQSGYVRDRDAEFNDRDIPKTDIVNLLKETRTMLSDTFEAKNDELLGLKYPLEVFGQPITHGEFLIHLLGHLNYHLGQINYHRRLLT
ncbi:MAG: DUF1572 family protein [Marinoscillum sp.]